MTSTRAPRRRKRRARASNNRNRSPSRNSLTRRAGRNSRRRRHEPRSVQGRSSGVQLSGFCYGKVWEISSRTLNISRRWSWLKILQKYRMASRVRGEMFGKFSPFFNVLLNFDVSDVHHKKPCPRLYFAVSLVDLDDPLRRPSVAHHPRLREAFLFVPFDKVGL